MARFFARLDACGELRHRATSFKFIPNRISKDRMMKPSSICRLQLRLTNRHVSMILFELPSLPVTRRFASEGCIKRVRRICWRSISSFGIHDNLGDSMYDSPDEAVGTEFPPSHH